jgi:hypothetical protein
MEKNEYGVCNNDKIVQAVKEYKDFYENYALAYQEKAIKIHEMIHGVIDWSHKEDHNAKIHLNKLGIAQDNWKATAKRGLMNFDEWMEVLSEPLMQSEYMDATEAKRMIEILLKDENPKVKIADALGLGFVENLCNLKALTTIKEIRGPKGKKYKSPRTTLVPLDIFDMAVDPNCVDIETEEPLFKIQTLEYPKHMLLKMASDEPDIEKPYIKSAIKELQGMPRDDKNRQERAKGKELLSAELHRAKNITLWEFYGTILDENGEVMEYENSKGERIVLENIKLTIGDAKLVVQEPVPLDELYIDGKDPFVHHRLIRNNKDILGRAMSHPGYELNLVLDELTSAITDSGMKAASNVTMYKPDFMEDPEEAAGGFTYDSNIAILPDADPNTVLTTASLGNLPGEMFSIYNILSESLAENVAKNSTALSGAFTGKQVRATEVAQAGQTVAAMDESILMDVDDVLIEGIITKVFRQGLGLAKFFNDFDLNYIFANNDKNAQKERIEAFKKLRKNKKKLFEELAYTFVFRGRGLRGISNQARTAQMTMNLLTSVLGNPMLIEILERNDWDLAEMLATGVKGMGVDPKTLKNKKVGEMARERQNFREMGRGIADMNGQGQQAQSRGAVAPTQRVTEDVSVGNDGNQQ